MCASRSVRCDAHLLDAPAKMRIQVSCSCDVVRAILVGLNKEFQDRTHCQTTCLRDVGKDATTLPRIAAWTLVRLISTEKIEIKRLLKETSL